MDIVWVGAAFALGWLAQLVRLPPLVGYLIAGFLLHALGVELSETLEHFADIGLTLLLFTIGLKLRLRTLLSPDVWGTATVHMALTVAVITGALMLLSGSGLLLFGGLTLAQAALLGFALSFSSTVFAVKVFEQTGSSTAPHARNAIGILIVQDLAAVVFLALASGKTPSIWAPLLLGLIPLRWLLMKILERTRRGELLVLCGLAIALGGAALFELVDVKGDLGALFAGLLLGSHPRAKELGRSLYSLKDLFLVGFFLSVGMAAAPTWAMAGSAGLVTILVPLKMALFVGLLLLFKADRGTASRSALSLANFSEFGLIVAAVALDKGWLPPDWVGAMAMAVSFTFAAGAPPALASEGIAKRWSPFLARFDRSIQEPQALVLPKGVEALVLGMGRVGSGAYDELEQEIGRGRVVGVDIRDKVLKRQKERGRQVIKGNLLEPAFFEGLAATNQTIRLALVTASHDEAILHSARYLKACLPGIRVAVASRHPDAREKLERAGVDEVFDLYTEAGVGLALQAVEDMDKVCTSTVLKAVSPSPEPDRPDSSARAS